MPRRRSLSRDRKSKTASGALTDEEQQEPKRTMSNSSSAPPSPKSNEGSLRSAGTPKAKGSNKISGGKGATGTSKKAAAPPPMLPLSSKPEDVTHVIRVTVLGLAGITVDKSQCRSGENAKTNLPAQPSDMKAVVAFSRGSEIRGTTALSKPLALSPTEVNSEAPDARPMRHVAVWSSDNKTLGSTVTFEANLRRFARTDSKASKTSSAFTPKSFELTIAITEENGEDNKVALPCGVSSLAVSGDECKNGQVATLDLPILSIAQARPLNSNKNGLGGYPMIAITPKPQDSDENLERQLQKKRSGLQKLFKRSGSEKFPTISVLERRLFASAYSMDATGDAVLRVALEVYEKGSDLEAVFADRRLRRESKNREGRNLSPPASTQKSMSLRAMNTSAVTSLGKPRSVSDHPDDETSASHGIEVPLVNNKPVPDDGSSQPSDEAASAPKETVTSLNKTAAAVVATATEEEKAGNEKGDEEGAEAYDDDSDEDSVVTMEDNTVAYFQWTTSTPPKSVQEEDNYTLSFTKKEKKEEPKPDVEPRCTLQDEDDNIVIKLFGRDLQVPTCGLRHVFDKDDDKSVWTHGASTWRDDGTYATAKLFGRAYKIPVPKFVRKDGDADVSESDGGSQPRRTRLSQLILNGMLCRPRPKSEKEINMVASLTDEEGFTIGSRSMGAASRLDGESLLSKESRSRAVESRSNESRNPAEQEKPDGTTAVESKGSPKTDESPKAVENFDAAKEQPEKKNADDNKRESAPLGSTLADLFACRYAFANGNGLRYEPYREEVPPVIIPADTDDVSIGDLTATTHEIRIATEDRMKKQNIAEQPRRGGLNLAKVLNPLPAALGGDGLCSLGETTKSSPIRMQGDDSVSILDSQEGENYFAEYDDHGSLLQHPLAPKQTKPPVQ